MRCIRLGLIAFILVQVGKAWATLPWTSYLAEPAVFPPLAVHNKLRPQEPPVSGRKQGLKKKERKSSIYFSVFVHTEYKYAHGQGTYLREVADTDSANSVVFYSNPFVLVCEFKCCKITQQTQNIKSLPLQ